jgi:hypothetical protein
MFIDLIYRYLLSIIDSQTGSPIMPGPVPSVSTKTRGYMQPPSFHTERTDPSTNASYSPIRFVYPGATYHPRNRAMSTSHFADSGVSSSWRHSISNESNVYIPSYQRKVELNAQVSQTFSPLTASVQQPANLIHRQFNSPLSLYSNDNVQEVMKHHHINQIK